MTSSVQVRFSTLAILAIAVAAAGLRLAMLGARPLDDHEAQVALHAAEGSAEASPFWAGSLESEAEPGYAALTSLLFQAVGTREASARAIPALAGILLALCPLLLRVELGEGKAIVASLLLAVSPIIVAASREAGGATLAGLGMALVFIAFVRSRSRAPSGPPERPRPHSPRGTCGGENGLGAGGSGWGLWGAVGLGLTLASGRAGWMGIASIVIGFTIAWLLARAADPQFLGPARSLMSRVWVAPALAIVLVSGAGLTVRFLPDFFSSFGVWLQGWTVFGGMDAAPALAALMLYEPLLIVFGAAGIVAAISQSQTGTSGRQGSTLLVSAGWAIGSLVTVTVYSSRRPEDLIFILIPLSMLAAHSLGRLAERIRPAENAPALAGMLGVLTVLAGFAAVQFSAYGHGQGPAFAALTPGTSLGLAVGAIILMVVVLFLFGAGWDYALARDAGVLAVLGIAAALSLSALWRLNIDPRGARAAELVRPQASTPSLPLLEDTVETFSQASTGRTDAMPIDLRGQPPPALAWALRRFPRALPISAGNTEQPLVVVAPEGQPPALGADYLGQVFTITERWNWQGVLPSNIVTWMVQREAAVWTENWILLLRADLASLGEAPAASDDTPAP